MIFSPAAGHRHSRHRRAPAQRLLQATTPTTPPPPPRMALTTARRWRPSRPPKTRHRRRPRLVLRLAGRRGRRRAASTALGNSQWSIGFAGSWTNSAHRLAAQRETATSCRIMKTGDRRQVETSSVHKSLRQTLHDGRDHPDSMREQALPAGQLEAEYALGKEAGATGIRTIALPPNRRSCRRASPARGCRPSPCRGRRPCTCRRSVSRPTCTAVSAISTPVRPSVSTCAVQRTRSAGSSSSNSTATRVIGSRWHSGIEISAVRLALDGGDARHADHVALLRLPGRSARASPAACGSCRWRARCGASRLGRHVPMCAWPGRRNGSAGTTSRSSTLGKRFGAS